MAILPMEQITICAMRSNRKALMELLQRRGTVEIQSAAVSDEVFGEKDTSASRLLFKKNARIAEQAVEIINKHSQEKKPMLAFLQGREGVPLPVANSFYSKSSTVLKVAQRVLQLEKDIAENKAELVRIEAQQEALTHWMNLPVPQTFAGTKKTAVFVGAVEGEHTAEELEEKLAEIAPELNAVHIEVVSATKAQSYLYAIALKTQGTEAEAALRAMGLVRPPSPTHHLPAQKALSLKEQQQQLLAANQAAEEEIIHYAPRREDIRFLEDHIEMRAEKYDMIDRLLQSRHVFVLKGYIPAKDATALEAELLEKFTCSVIVEPVEEADEPPIQLKNSWFCEPTETVVESYSYPGKGEIDPTNVMSIFYYLMFGLMFSDAGYGLILAGACLFCLLKFKNMEPNWSKYLRLFFWCGVATIFWGVVFSSYFGDSVDVIAKVFFGRAQDAASLVPPLWFVPLQKPMLMLMFCLGIGVVHLTTAYVMQAVTKIRQKAYLDVLYDAVFPAFAFLPFIVILLGTDMFESMAGFKLNISPLLNNICLGVAVVCIIGVLLFAGRESRGYKRILKGIYAVYNTLAGWLGDVLSYSRLLALGLATGILASVLNQLGTMAGNGIFGIILFLVVFVLGNSLNFGINVLGSYVHSNRLEFVEFFGKFYEGGGRKFNPFGIHTKHYKIEEETQND